jgi:hypothetical protein
MAQLGYACFWPKGGGQTEVDLGRSSSSNDSQTVETTSSPPDGHGTENRIHVGGASSNDGSDSVEEDRADEVPEMIAPDSS